MESLTWKFVGYSRALKGFVLFFPLSLRKKLWVWTSSIFLLNLRILSDTLTLPYVIMNNGQTYFKIIAVWTPIYLWSKFSHFSTLCMERLTLEINSGKNSVLVFCLNRISWYILSTEKIKVSYCFSVSFFFLFDNFFCSREKVKIVGK